MGTLSPVKDFIGFEEDPGDKDAYIKYLEDLVQIDIAEKVDNTINGLAHFAHGVDVLQLHAQVTLFGSIVKLTDATATMVLLMAKATSREEMRPAEDTPTAQHSAHCGRLPKSKRMSSGLVHNMIKVAFNHEVTPSHTLQDVDELIGVGSAVPGCEQRAVS